MKPSRQSWKSRRESPGSDAGRGRSGGGGRGRRPHGCVCVRGCLLSPVKTRHLSFSELKDDERATLTWQVQRHAREPWTTREHKHVRTYTRTWVSCVYASGKVLMSERLLQVWCYRAGGKHIVHLFGSQPTKPPAYRGPCRASYLASMFLHLPSSFRKSATSWRRAEFSFSRKDARIAIWFSFSLRASRERLAAMLFFLRRAQYLSSCSLVTGGRKQDVRFQPRAGSGWCPGTRDPTSHLATPSGTVCANLSDCEGCVPSFPPAARTHLSRCVPPSSLPEYVPDEGGPIGCMKASSSTSHAKLPSDLSVFFGENVILRTLSFHGCSNACW